MEASLHHHCGTVDHRVGGLWLTLDLTQVSLLSLYIYSGYLAKNVHIVIVVLVLVLVLIVKHHLFLRLVNCRLEDLVRPWVLLSPIVFFGFVLEVVASDIWISVADADVNAFVLQHTGDFSKHLLGVLFGVGSTLSSFKSTRMESSMPLSITQSKVSFSNKALRLRASAWRTGWGWGYTWRRDRILHCGTWAACLRLRFLRSQYWWCCDTHPHTCLHWKANCLYEGSVTCADIEDLAIPADVLRDDITQVGPVLVPIKLRAVPTSYFPYSAYRFSQKACLP